MSPISIQLRNGGQSVAVTSKYDGEQTVKAFYLSIMGASNAVECFGVQDDTFVICGPGIKEQIELDPVQVRQIESLINKPFHVQALGVTPEDGFAFIPR